MKDRITDLSFFKQNSFGDMGIYHELLEIFVKTTPPMLEQMREAIASNNRAALAQVAHKLKSNVQSVGLNNVYTLLGELETNNGTKNQEHLQKTFGSVLHFCQMAVAEVQAELEKETN